MFGIQRSGQVKLNHFIIRFFTKRRWIAYMSIFLSRIPFQLSPKHWMTKNPLHSLRPSNHFNKAILNSSQDNFLPPNLSEGYKTLSQSLQLTSFNKSYLLCLNMDVRFMKDLVFLSRNYCYLRFKHFFFNYKTHLKYFSV